MTKITDLVPSEKILAAQVDMLQRNQNTLLNSGIAVDATVINANVVNGGSRKFGVPFLNSLSTAAVNYSTDDATVGPVGKLTAGELTALRHDQNWGWEYFDLTQMVTQFNIAGGISAGISAYWDAQTEAVAYKSILGSALASSDLRFGSASVALSRDLIIDAAATAGEFMNSFNILIVSPKNLARLQKDRDNFVQGSTAIDLPTYAGMRVIVSNAVGASQSIIARNGAVALSSGVVNGTTGIAIQRDENSGNGGGREVLRSRRSFVAHPQGMNYKAAHVAPTHAQLAAAASWELAIPAEHVGFRVLTHTSDGADAPAG